MDHPDQAYPPGTEKAKTIAGGCIAQARRGTTSGPKGCGQEVRNWQQAMDGLSVSRGETATRPKGSIRKRCASPVLPPQNLQSTLDPDDPEKFTITWRW